MILMRLITLLVISMQAEHYNKIFSGLSIGSAKTELENKEQDLKNLQKEFI